MTRVDSDVLLVGSLPAESTEAALRAAADLFGDLVFALPDGETGPWMHLDAGEFATIDRGATQAAPWTPPS